MKSLRFENSTDGVYKVYTANSLKVGELFRLEDGFYVYEQFRAGALSEYDLKEIYEKLKELNKPQDNSVNLYFALEKVGLSEWLTKKIGNLVLYELDKHSDFSVEWFVGHLQDLKSSNTIEIVDYFTPKGERLAGVVIDNNTKYIMVFHCTKDVLKKALKEIGYEE